MRMFVGQFPTRPATDPYYLTHQGSGGPPPRSPVRNEVRCPQKRQEGGCEIVANYFIQDPVKVFMRLGESVLAHELSYFTTFNRAGRAAVDARA